MSHKTVDNLGIDAHINYARSEGLKDISGGQEAVRISSVAEYDNFAPTTYDQFSTLFNTNIRNIPWGVIDKPQGYDIQQKRVFTYQIAPSLGSEEKQELCIKRIEDHIARHHLEATKQTSPDSVSPDAAEKKEETDEQNMSFDQNAEEEAKEKAFLMQKEGDQSSNVSFGQMMTVQEEGETLKKLLEMMIELDKILLEANRKRKQYQKG